MQRPFTGSIALRSVTCRLLSLALLVPLPALVVLQARQASGSQRELPGLE
jgi:hypothetical protein